MFAYRRAANRRGACALAMVSALALGASCSKGGETVVRTAEGRSRSAEAIDHDPLALLPSGAAGFIGLDAPALFKSEFGAKALELVQRAVLVPSSSGFSAERDIDRIVLGLYLLQGLDLLAVATGRFDASAIEQAAAGAANSTLGVPLVKSSYTGRSLFTANNMGFVVLTPRTGLLGSEAGIRRALDRMAEGRTARDLPAWAADLLERPSAPLVGALDLQESPVTQAARDEMPFLAGLSRVRWVGNFQPPGVNLAGTGVYADAGAAQAGAAKLREVQRMAQTWGWLAALVGIQQPLKRLETRPVGTDLEFVTELDARAVVALLDRALLASQTLRPGPGGK